MNKVIGLDFDNTIVNYDLVIAKLIENIPDYPKGRVKTKEGIKSFLKGKGLDDKWTEMQGMIYGPGMKDALPYSGAIEILKNLEQLGYDLRIVSHRSRYPYLGKRYDLHSYARQWIEEFLSPNQLFVGDTQAQNVTFHETKEEKIQKIRDLDCKLFVDDLSSVLQHKLFPETTRKVLFKCADVESNLSKYDDEIFIMKRWEELPSIIES